jgi:hypothetical protein
MMRKASNTGSPNPDQKITTKHTKYTKGGICKIGVMTYAYLGTTPRQEILTTQGFLNGGILEYVW